MNTRLTLIIAVIMSIIGTIYLLDLKNNKKKVEDKYEKSKVFTSNYENTDYFSIFRKSELLSFEKKDGFWYMISPESHLAGESETESILNIMQNLNIEDIIDENPKDLDEFGLKPPSMILTLKSAEKEETILVGTKNYSQASYFAKRDNSPEVFTISNIGLSNFESPAEKFISRAALAISPSNIYEVKIKNKKEAIELSKEPLGENNYKWNIIHPKRKVADSDKVEEFLWNLKNTEVDKNMGKSLDGEDFKHNNDIEIVFKQKNMPDEVFYAIKNKNGYYHCISSITNNVTEIKNLDEIIPESYIDFEDFHLLKQNLADFSKIEINFEDKHILIKRNRKNLWVLDKKQDLDSEINTLLINLQSLEYNPSKTDSKKQKLYMSIRLSNKNIHEEIKIYKSGENYFTEISGIFYNISADKFIQAVKAIEEKDL